MLSQSPPPKSHFSPNLKSDYKEYSRVNAYAEEKKSFSNKLHDDIECVSWLEEINMAQYSHAFLLNLSADGKILIRKRLQQIRLQDLPKMNITNFLHQKILMEHIHHVLNNAFQSPVRRSEIKAILSAKYPDLDLDSMKPRILKKSNAIGDDQKRGESAQRRRSIDKATKTRRRSFDTHVWQSISNLRTRDASSTAAAALLREGVLSQEPKKLSKLTKRRSRHSFDKDVEPHSATGASTVAPLSSAAHSAKQRAQHYGNMALEFDTLSTNLRTIQVEYLNAFRTVLNCEVAAILLLNDRTRELMLYSDTNNLWYKIPPGTGVAGYCAETGQSLNIPDAYADWRFNSNLDIRTGFKTRNILCQPIRAMRGGGAVVGVIQMLNKRKGQDFDAQDEQALANCVQRIADDMNERFKDLLLVAERFSGTAIFVGSKGGSLSKPAAALHESHTASSQSRKAVAKDSKLPEL